MQKQILFLDFDGVLHPGNPIDPRQRYAHVPLLADWLRRWPDVHVVISSAWRARLSLAQIKDIFPTDIQPRVVGATPSLPAGPLQREREILAWLMAHGNATTPWAALDDDADQFSVGSPFLVPCYIGEGLTEHALSELEQRLS